MLRLRVSLCLMYGALACGCMVYPLPDPPLEDSSSDTKNQTIDSDSESTSSSETETAIGTDSGSETDTETESESATETESETVTETESEIGTETESETDTETESELDTETESDTDTGLAYAPGRPLSAGRKHNCILLANGPVKCWGLNDDGQLGYGDTDTHYAPSPTESAFDSGVVSVTSGYHHSCALLTDDSVQCWGDGTWGQLGNDGGGSSLTPVDVVGIADPVASVSAGDYHSCALTTNGSVQCWGDNTRGQCGNGASGQPQEHTAVQVTGLTADVTSLSAGYEFTCVVQNGAVKCWGYNFQGELGNDTYGTAFRTPVGIPDLDFGVASVSTGEDHACALLDTGALKCWGENYYGQLGHGGATGTGQRSPTPVDVIDLGTDVSAVDCGHNHTCALLNTGDVKCFGYSGSGQLGDSQKVNSNVPVGVMNLGNQVVAISLGLIHSCALKSNGTVWCWGDNSSGQLGNGTTDPSLGQTTPIPVFNIP